MNAAEFAAKVRRRETVVGYWIQLDSPASTERVARLGYDYVSLDAQHGLFGYSGMLAALTAIDAAGRAVGLVRVAANDATAIGRALDAGAAGVIAPLVNTAEDAAAAVAAGRYPPTGIRSYGPARSSMRIGPTPADADSAVVVLAMIETAAGLENVDAIAATPGLDGLYIGPSDLTIAVGGADPADPAVADAFEAALVRVRRACEANGLAAGLHTSSGQAATERIAEGFTFVTVAGDLTHLEAAAAAHLAAVDRQRVTPSEDSGNSEWEWISIDDVESGKQGTSRLRIGVLASIAHRTPPRGYGPWEQVASTLAEGLVALGHDVTLFATADSLTAGRLHAEAPHGYEEDPGVDVPGYDVKVYEGLHNAAAFERADEFDVLSNQFDFLPLTYSRLVSTPVVTTIHGFSSERIVPVYRAYDDIGHYVAISDADRHPDLTYDATIHHGIDLSPFTFRDRPGDYLLFLGRIHPDKGTHRAVEVARRAGLPLVIAGIVQDRGLLPGARRAAPRTAPASRYVGPVGPAERDALLGGALALLHLIGFAEPFGLSVVESLATGTPVIAYPLGSMPEIIRPGRTGFLVDDVDGAVEAVGRVGSLSRRHCRDDVEERFTAARMVADYAELFARIASGGPSAVSRSTSSGTSTKANRTDASLAP